jgi:hypothetical protein
MEIFPTLLEWSGLEEWYEVYSYCGRRDGRLEDLMEKEGSFGKGVGIERLRCGFCRARAR